MIFKQRKDNDTISLRDDLDPIMPEPEVGKIYHSFDDGKIRLSRLVDWKIMKRIDLDKGEASKTLLKNLQREVDSCYWIFDPEQTIVFYAKAVGKDGKYDKDIGTCVFLRTKEGGWFGAWAKFLWWCELDVDNRWYNELIKEAKEWAESKGS